MCDQSLFSGDIEVKLLNYQSALKSLETAYIYQYEAHRLCVEIESRLDETESELSSRDLTEAEKLLITRQAQRSKANDAVRKLERDTDKALRELKSSLLAEWKEECLNDRSE